MRNRLMFYVISLRVRFWHWAMRFSARAHYLATRQAADNNLEYINAHKRDIVP